MFLVHFARIVVSCSPSSLRSGCRCDCCLCENWTLGWFEGHHCLFDWKGILWFLFFLEVLMSLLIRALKGFLGGLSLTNSECVEVIRWVLLMSSYVSDFLLLFSVSWFLRTVKFLKKMFSGNWTMASRFLWAASIQSVLFWLLVLLVRRLSEIESRTLSMFVGRFDASLHGYLCALCAFP